MSFLLVKMLGDHSSLIRSGSNTGFINELPSNDPWDLEQLLPEDQVILLFFHSRNGQRQSRSNWVFILTKN